MMEKINIEVGGKYLLKNNTYITYVNDDTKEDSPENRIPTKFKTDKFIIVNNIKIINKFFYEMFFNVINTTYYNNCKIVFYDDTLFTIPHELFYNMRTGPDGSILIEMSKLKNKLYVATNEVIKLYNEILKIKNDMSSKIYNLSNELETKLEGVISDIDNKIAYNKELITFINNDLDGNNGI